MSVVDLSQLDLKELQNLQKEVSLHISSFEKRRLEDAREAVERAAKEHGFSLKELVLQKQSRKPAKVKYADPANPDNTWSGRGRKPHWVMAYLNAGKTLEDLAR